MSTSSCPCLRIVVPHFVFAVICVGYVHTLLTAPFSQPLSHFVCYYRTLQSHIIFACLSPRAFSHAMFAHWRQHCFFQTLLFHSVYLCYVRMPTSYIFCVRYFCKKLSKQILGCYCRMLRSHATFRTLLSHATFARYVRMLVRILFSKRYFPKLNAHATLARSVRIPFLHVIQVSQTLSPPSASNLCPTL